mmetsp:Transcript_41859/g.40203  ORF Transcript_41859/g.40203 Transcript_41859/m.40203 type:complete len:81 (-) Transcript_41859:1167-1409(-)
MLLHQIVDDFQILLLVTLLLLLLLNKAVDVETHGLVMGLLDVGGSVGVSHLHVPILHLVRRDRRQRLVLMILVLGRDLVG